MAVMYATKLAILLLWAAALFDPTGALFHLKYFGLATFGVALLINISVNKFPIGSKSSGVFIFFIFFIFLQFYGLLVGVIRGGGTEKFIDTSYIFSSGFFSFVFLLLEKNNFDYSINVLIRLCGLLGSLIFSAYAFTILDLNQWNYFFLSKGLAYISERNYGDLTLPYIYFIVSPILVFAICKSANDVLRSFSIFRLGKLLFFVASLALTGTRMNILFSFLSVFIAFSWFKWGRVGYLYLFIFSIISLFILVVSDIGVVNSFFDSSEANNNTKLGYLPYYLEELNSVSTLIFGQGFNAHGWSSGLSMLLAPDASKLELTYLELMRVFGVPLGAGFMVSIFWFLFSTTCEKSDPNSWIQPASISYALMATLNPYLFSLDGMMVLGTAFAYRHHARRRQLLRRADCDLSSNVIRNPYEKSAV